MPRTALTVTVIGIEYREEPFDIVGLDGRGEIVLPQKCSQGQKLDLPMTPCLIGIEACVGAHHLSRKLRALRPADAGEVCAPYSTRIRTGPSPARTGVKFICDGARSLQGRKDQRSL